MALKLDAMTSSMFDPQVYQGRLDATQRLCVEKGLSGIIVPTGAQLAYLTGSWISTHERFTALVIPAIGTPTFILPGVDRGDLTRSAIPDLGVEVRGWNDGEDARAIAVELLGESNGAVAVGADLTADHLLAIQQLMPATDFVLANSLLAELFVAKDDAEIEQLALAGEAIDRVHAAVPELLKAGRTEKEVADYLTELILTEHTAVDFVIVGSGPNGANAHHDFSDRVLEDDDVVVVDIGGTYGPGYHSDCTRTYCVGDSAPAEFSDYYKALLRAQEAAVQAVKPGVTAESIDAVARDILSDAGLGEYFIHRTGHGIGLSTHEEPFIMQGNQLVLQEGMAFSIEPGFYIEGKYGARIEDIVVVTADGCHRLNNQPRELR